MCKVSQSTVPVYTASPSAEEQHFTQVDVHQLSRLLVDQNVLDVSVPQAHDVSDCEDETDETQEEFTYHSAPNSPCRAARTYRGGGHAAGVGQPLLHPHRRVQEALHAEVPEDGPEVPAHLAVGLQLLVERRALRLLW